MKYFIKFKISLHIVPAVFSLFFLLLLPMHSHAGVGFVGGNLGLDYLTASSDETGFEQTVLLYGLTGKYFFGDDAPALGLGFSYNISEREIEKEYRNIALDPNVTPYSGNISGKWETDFLTLDLMYNFMHKADYVGYASLSYVMVDYKLSFESDEVSAVTALGGSSSMDTYAIGLGFFSNTKGSFSLGGEIKYIGPPEGDDFGEDAFIHAYISLGYVF